MRRLFRRARARPDTRPALMSVAALMVLLLPLLLMTSSAQKLTGIALGVPGPGEDLPPEPPGAVERIVVSRAAGGYRVEAAVRTTDVRAQVGDTEQRRFEVPDLAGLQEVLLSLKRLDPERERIVLVPAPDTPAEEVVAWMDAVRAGPEGPLFPRVILSAEAL